MKKKILVIGANSFIASNLIFQLKNEAKVVGVYHSNKEKLSNDIINIPVNDLNKLDEHFDEVYLLGAYIPDKQPITSDNRKKMFASNVELVDLVCNKFKSSKIIYSSTVSVYKNKMGEISEQDNEGGINEYGISKLWGEKIVLQAENFSIVRFSSVYGIGMNLNTIIPNYIKQALKNNVVTVWGNGERKQNYIHAFDVINFLKKAASINENGIFLATAPQSISNYQLAQIISKKTDCSITLKGEDLTPSFLYNNNYTVNKLQYEASVSFDKGITELIEWIRKKY
jgi:nucleoside-diphosphate-sugar epimerase